MTSRDPLSVRERPATAQCWEQNSFWLMSFGDLMLLLLCFFVLLTVVDQASPPHGPAIPTASVSASPAITIPEADLYSGAHSEWRAPENPVLDEGFDLPGYDEVDHDPEPVLVDEGDKVEAILRDIFRPAGDRVEIEARAGAVTVRLRDTITFRSGSAELLPDVRSLLDGVADFLCNRPDIRIETAGHTDEVPIATSIYPSNWELSAARAAAVARYILAHAQLDPRRIQIAGYGAYQPVDTRRSAAARARNRRVEIRFVHPLTGEHDVRG